MNKQVTNYIANFPPEKRIIMEKIRQLITETVPGVSEEFKWSRPVFKSNRDFVYIQATKSHVNLGFFNFEKLDDPENRLEGSGKKMRHVKLFTPDDIDADLFKKWFQVLTD
jgi:hypothetical protein